MMFTKRQLGCGGGYWGFSLSGNCWPDKLSLGFGEFDVGIVQLTNDLGTPQLVKQTKFLGQVDRGASFAFSVRLVASAGHQKRVLTGSYLLSVGATRAE